MTDQTMLRQQSLEVLPTVINAVLIRTAKVFRDPSALGEKDLSQVVPHLNRFLPDAIDQFHRALDDLEVEIIRAKSIFARDFDLWKAQEAENERVFRLERERRLQELQENGIEDHGVPMASAKGAVSGEAAFEASPAPASQAPDIIVIDGLEQDDRQTSAGDGSGRGPAKTAIAETKSADAKQTVSIQVGSVPAQPHTLATDELDLDLAFADDSPSRAVVAGAGQEPVASGASLDSKPPDGGLSQQQPQLPDVDHSMDDISALLPGLEEYANAAGGDAVLAANIGEADIIAIPDPAANSTVVSADAAVPSTDAPTATTAKPIASSRAANLTADTGIDVTYANDDNDARDHAEDFGPPESTNFEDLFYGSAAAADFSFEPDTGAVDATGVLGDGASASIGGLGSFGGHGLGAGVGVLGDSNHTIDTVMGDAALMGGLDLDLGSGHAPADGDGTGDAFDEVFFNLGGSGT